MDLVVYLIALFVLFSMNTNKVSTDQVDITPSAIELPLGSNLGLKKEEGAYMAILKQLGLLR